MLIAVPVEGETPSRDDILVHMAAQMAKWQVPDDVIFVEALPLTATGKVSKKTLREIYVAGAETSAAE